MSETVFRLKHVPTGLFYCSRKGRFKDDITNLSEKGSFYLRLRDAEKILKTECEYASINKAQFERYALKNRNEPASRYCYSKAFKKDFVIVEYELLEKIIQRSEAYGETEFPGSK